MTATYETIDTPDGPFTVLVDAQQRVIASGWTGEIDDLVLRLDPKDRPADMAEGRVDAAEAARAYYAGDLAAIDDVAVHQPGTPFQELGWRALRRITPGEPLSYTEFAAELGKPNAVRAAASICALNAPALFIPCHRVRRHDGSLGGFAWGLEVKESLLAHEAAHSKLRSANSQA
ncbi:methylated-DNA--[protein]-cysteine S-methyltransferase [Microbacterium invictum]|uniref:Methylated-DNA-[protein]-cysteine S-methyltransferase n=1 Tax=Microbacterium invictum TaxID=515415 RepID=A0AA40SPF4_9MICO|nr:MULTISPECIES: methylated-DNA--[protein]-cysteine S-methyltransferase [Microbacterium]MBB4139899.1 methylated-DNA-[protein]-cysteine S-methyltransferase [Microbacterium invictum]